MKKFLLTGLSSSSSLNTWRFGSFFLRSAIYEKNALNLFLHENLFFFLTESLMWSFFPHFLPLFSLRFGNINGVAFEGNFPLFHLFNHIIFLSHIRRKWKIASLLGLFTTETSFFQRWWKKFSSCTHNQQSSTQRLCNQPTALMFSLTYDAKNIFVFFLHLHSSLLWNKRQYHQWLELLANFCSI